MMALLSREERDLLRSLVRWVRRFTIMYAALWVTLTLAFFALVLYLWGASR